MEDALAAAYRQNQSIIDNTTAIVYAFDLEERFLMVNKALADLLKSTPAKMIGKRRHEFMPKKDADWHEANDRQVIEAGKPLELEEVSELSVRSITWLTTKFPLRDAQGKIYAVAGISVDISERKTADAELAYRATFAELDPSPIVELDATGHIIYMNPSAKILFPDLSRLSLKHPYLLGWRALVKEINVDDKGYHTRDIKVGDSWYEQVVSRIPTNQNFRIYGKDITVRKRADELKDEFIGMVSHELRTPLTVIMGALATATDQRIKPKDARELLGDAVVHAGILSNMVDNLLELSRYQSDRLVLDTKAVGIAELVETVLQSLRSKSANHHLVSEMPSILALTEADPFRVERILFNLVDNAIKYSPAGGEVKVVVRQNDEYLIIGVADHGMGISADDQSRLFQSFERLGARVHGSIQGTGLGLSICRILTEAHGGRIWVESEKGKGSTFFFSLPVAQN